MAFLESRLKQFDDVISPPSKEGGLSALEGKKVGNFMGYHIYTVPLFRHSFKYWKRYLANNTLGMMQATLERCDLQCKNDTHQLNGNSFNLFETNLEKCRADCKQKWGGPVLSNLEVAEMETNKVFNKCLAGKIKNEIEYENVLDCKSVAFQDFMTRVLNYEEQYLNEALKKYA